MHQKQWITYTTKALVIGILGVSSLWVLRPETANAQYGEGCNIYGCSKSPGVDCNPFGCPNPGAEACSSSGCPDSPTSKPNDDSNSSDNSNRPISGECMDRVMYRDVQAKSGPMESGAYKGDYEYDLASDIPNDAIRQAGFDMSGSGVNYHSEPTVRIRLKTPEEAAKICR